MATVTASIVGLSVNQNSHSNLSLKGTGFVKGAGGTLVTVQYPVPGTGALQLEWTGKVHKKNSSDSTKSEVKVTQNRATNAEDLKRLTDVTDTVRILVDATHIDVTAELYVE